MESHCNGMTLVTELLYHIIPCGAHLRTDIIPYFANCWVKSIIPVHPDQ